MSAPLLTTPPFFAGLGAVDVVGGGTTRVVAPDRAGRLRFSADLGPAHHDQEFTDASRAAGQDEPDYFRRATVTFAPHARLVVGRPVRRRGGLRVWVRAVGPTVRGVRSVPAAGWRAASQSETRDAAPRSRACSPRAALRSVPPAPTRSATA